MNEPHPPATEPRANAPEPVACARLLAIHAAASAEACAQVLLEALAATGMTAVAVAWSPHWPEAIAVLPRDRACASAAAAALLAHRACAGSIAHARVMCDDGECAAVLLDPSGAALPVSALHAAAPWLAAAGTRLNELLQAQRLQAAVAQLAQAEQLQHALFAIADMAGSDLDMPQMLQGLHRIVGRLMYAENFYIAMYEREREALRFLYFVDTVDPDGATPGAEVALAELAHSVTWYLLRDGQPLMGTSDSLRTQVSGPLRLLSADSEDWLGVPMSREGQVRGAVVVQSYLPGIHYTAADQALLAFVADHILTALERKRGQAELEQRVAQRTAQLAQANAGLQQQVAERERAEHLQSTLYRIAALTSTDEGSEAFYRQIHAAVGELLNAENFYIALLSDDGTRLEFPYSVDAVDGPKPSRPLRRGLSEYVIRRGTALLSDLAMDQRLIDSGQIDPVPPSLSPSLFWLGVPLLDGERVIGVVAVQSYTAQVRYDERDAELLTFVSHQIASSLQRRRGAEALRRLNAELEQRVTVRTRELREQIAERERIEAQLKHQVMHDPLTGLPNRLYLRERLLHALAGFRRHPDRHFALLYLDIDRFKLINDQLGHLAGDEVLREVGRRLGECVRAPDMVARLSGDEFALLLEDAPRPAAIEVAQRIQAALLRPMQVAGRDLHASASIGIAIAGEQYHGIDQLLHDADVALYRAKSAGRQRFMVFEDPPAQPAAVAVLDLG